MAQFTKIQLHHIYLFGVWHPELTLKNSTYLVYGLVFDPMTLIYELDLNMVVTYLHAKNKMDRQTCVKHLPTRTRMVPSPRSATERIKKFVRGARGHGYRPPPRSITGR